MRIVLLGGPGAGKGTQGDHICNQLDIPKISTGDMLRAAVAADSPLGKAAKVIMDAGELVSDDIILGLVNERVSEKDCQKGFLFDGFPRTIAQAEGLLGTNIKLDLIIEIMVDDEEIVKRMSGRWVHSQSGRTYHSIFNPPQTVGIDDITGGPLVQRDDDKEATVRKRLSVYKEQTEPLVSWFEDYSFNEPSVCFERVDGVGDVEHIRLKILSLLDR